MSPTTRRSFLKTSLAAGAMATTGILPLVAAAKRTATDTVVLGRSNVQVTRLAFGTGTNSGSVQAALGQQEFTRLVRYAYDRGIRFFETAEAYETPGMLGEALKGLPRDSYQLMSKVTTFHQGIDPQAKFDELQHFMGSDAQAERADCDAVDGRYRLGPDPLVSSKSGGGVQGSRPAC